MMHDLDFSKPDCVAAAKKYLHENADRLPLVGFDFMKGLLAHVEAFATSGGIKPLSMADVFNGITLSRAELSLRQLLELADVLVPLVPKGKLDADQMQGVYAYRQNASEIAETLRKALAKLEAGLPDLNATTPPAALAAANGGAPGFTVEQLTDLINEHVGHAYWCNREWSAWQVGTMTEDDFSPVSESDIPSELAAFILERAALAASGGEPGGQWISVGERLPDPVDAVLALSVIPGDSRVYIARWVPHASPARWWLRDSAEQLAVVTHWMPLPTTSI